MRSWNLTEGDEFSNRLDHCGFVLKACRGDFGKRLDCDIKNIKCQLNDLRNRRDEAALSMFRSLDSRLRELFDQ